MSKTESPEMVKKVVAEVSFIVSEMAGIQLGERQESMVENRLRTRMLKLNMPTFEEYLNFLKHNQETESQALLSLLTTHHTYFFREFSHFEHLLNHGLNSMIDKARSRPDKTIRIWSAACSRGQEVYSLAMFFNFHLKHMAPDVKFEISASDVDPESVEIAKNGVYKNEELKQCPAMYMDGNWSKGSGDVKEFSKVKDSLKNHCKFLVVNLFQPESFLTGKKFDLIFCRNVFIYFKPEQIKQITKKFLEHLDPQGFIYLGVSETLNGLELPIALTGPSVYRHKEAVAGLNVKTRISSDQYKVPSTLLNDPTMIKAFEEPTPAEAKTYEVLCVDDSQTIHALLGKILTADHHFKIIDKAMNGREALDLLKTKKYDIITLDLHMPEVDGVGFLKEYKGEIPVVVLSSINRDDPSVAQQAVKFGAKDYIEKPSLENFAQACNEIRSKLKAILTMSQAMKAKPAQTATAQSVGKPLTSQPARTTVSTSKPNLTLVKSGVSTSKPVSTFKASTTYKSTSTSVASKSQPVKVGAATKTTISTSFSSNKTPTNQGVVKPFVKPVANSTVRPTTQTAQRTAGKPATVTTLKTTISPSTGSHARTSQGSSALKINPLKKPDDKDGQGAVSVQKKIKALIVDDSGTIRKLLKEILTADPAFEIVAEAEKPSQVEDLILKHKPDLITLDIHMPEMDGVTLLKNYLPKYKIPTVMISSISKEEGPQVLDALESGAVDYIQKPQMNQLAEAAQIIRERLKTAAQVKVRIRNKVVKPVAGQRKFADLDSLIVLGSSTGGTEALREVFQGLPNEIPPIVVVQHIPPVFSAAFAHRLNQILPFEVREAKDGDIVKPNQVLIAPGGKQMSLKKKGSQISVIVNDDAPMNRHKPSVDYLFKSVAQLQLPKVIAGVLTGMGADGAEQLKSLKHAGAKTFAQDEATSVVYGMPKEAYERGGAEAKVALESIAMHIVDLSHEIASYKKNSA